MPLVGSGFIKDGVPGLKYTFYLVVTITACLAFQRYAYKLIEIVSVFKNTKNTVVSTICAQNTFEMIIQENDTDKYV